MKDNRDKGESLVLVVLTVECADGTKERNIGNISRPATSAYTQNWERIFGTKTDTSIN